MKRTAAFMILAAGLMAAQDAVSNAQAQEALRQYRSAWQNMSPAQQKQLIQAGGYTPEQYERMLTDMQRGAAPAKPAVSTSPAESVSRRPAQPLQTSNEDLNSLRDTNVRKVNKTGCPPEVAMRIAQLKSQLGKPVSSRESLDLAESWHQRSAAPVDEAKEKERLLETVLGLQSAQKANDQAADSQKIEAEFQRLAAMCPEVR